MTTTKKQRRARDTVLAVGAGLAALLIMVLRPGRAFASGGVTVLPPPTPTLSRDLTGVIDGALYRIVSVPADRDIRKVQLLVVSYPPRPDVEGRLFFVANTIDKYGSGHPTVEQAQTYLDAGGQ
tara:strand:+ start:148 stop:519 length:372 start_codon:yes stop_codon:yes gene_type:complete